MSQTDALQMCSWILSLFEGQNCTSNIVCKLLASTADRMQEKDDSFAGLSNPEVVQLLI